MKVTVSAELKLPSIGKGMSVGGNSRFNVINEDAEMYSVIRPAEVCSIDTAKKFGLFDKRRYLDSTDVCQKDQIFLPCLLNIPPPAE